jgi:hypothetical protein
MRQEDWEYKASLYLLWRVCVTKEKKKSAPNLSQSSSNPTLPKTSSLPGKDPTNGFLLHKSNATKSLEINTCVFLEQSTVKIQSKYITSYFMFSETE